MTCIRPRFFQRVMLAADVGFGESYVDGDWTSPDLVALLSLLSLREEVVDDRSLWSALPARIVNLISHLRRTNTPAGSRRNIREHYDLSNELYRLFLDPTMSYSSGIFLEPTTASSSRNTTSSRQLSTRSVSVRRTMCLKSAAAGADSPWRR